MIKITGGIYKGLTIDFKKGNIRPTLGIVRESVFNMLRDIISNAVFIDLFAGSGIMGIEALSRGARYVYFNDIDQTSLNIIKENLDKLKISPERYKITKKDGIKLFKKIEVQNPIYYMDPPFGYKKMNQLIENFENSNFFYGFFEFPVEKKYKFSYIYRERIYGNVKLVVEKKI